MKSSSVPDQKAVNQNPSVPSQKTPKTKIKFKFRPSWKKVLKICSIFLLIGSLVSCAVYGYQIWNEYEDLKEELESSELSGDEFTTQLSELEDDLVTLQKEYNLLSRQKEAVLASHNELSDNFDEAEDTISDYEVAQASIGTYNDFLDYFRLVIETHGGFEGWTTAEYNHAHDLAEDTGSSSFVSVVEYAWNNTDIPPATRVIDVIEAIVAGINANM
jgi:molybdopterin converting factor small subunit